MTLQDAVRTYKEYMNFEESDWLPWVKQVHSSLVTGNESNFQFYLPFVKEVYDYLKNQNQTL